MAIYYCRLPSLRGALLMRRTLAVRRFSGVVHARVLCNRAREPLQRAALEALDVRLPWCARGYLHHAHHALMRSLYIGALTGGLAAGVSSFSLPTQYSAGFSLCAFAPLCSPLCTALFFALLSALLSSLRYTSLCSALLFSFLSRLRLVSACHSSRTTPTLLFSN